MDFFKVVIDTNVIVKLVLETVSPEENRLLTSVIEDSKEVMITPNVFSESSYFVEKHSGWKAVKEKTIRHVLAFSEKYVEKNAILDHRTLEKFRVVDTSLVILLEREGPAATLLSYDWPLIQWCRKNKLSAAHPHELLYMS